MKNRLFTGILALCLQLPLLSTTAIAQGSESFEAFHDRMLQTYDIDIINKRDCAVTQQEQVNLEEGFRFWGADLLRTVSANARHWSPTDTPSVIVLTPRESDVLCGKMVDRIIYLYGNWDQCAVIHELTHMIHALWFELGAPTSIKETEARLAQCNDGRAYGSPWTKSDEQYFTCTYGKTNFRDDMATIMQFLYDDKQLVERIHAGQLPALKKKIAVIRDYVVNNIGPTTAFDAVLGPDPVTKKEAVFIIPECSNLTLKKNGTYRLKTGWTFPMGSTGAVKYSSYNPSIAKVDSTGLITFVGSGRTSIVMETVRTGNKATCLVSDVTPATNYNFKTPGTTIDLGGTFQLEVEMKPEGASGPMSYSSDNKNVATVDANGVITGRSAGTAKISAYLYTAHGGYSKPPFPVAVTSKPAVIQKPAEEKKPEAVLETDDITKPAEDLKTADVSKPETPAKPAASSKPETPAKPVVKPQTKVLTIKTEPVKKNYAVGESFDPSGLTAVYTITGPGGTKSTQVTPNTLTFSCSERSAFTKGYKFRSAGTKEVTVGYGYTTAKFTIVVTADSAAKPNNAVPAASGKSYAGVHKIFAAASTKQCIGVRRSNMENGAEVIIAPSGNIADQQFAFEKVGDKYRIKAMHSGKYLTVDGDWKNGTYITQSDAVDDRLQLFEVIDAGNGSVKLKTDKGFFATPMGGSIKTASRIVIWQEKGNYNQQFRLTNAQ